MFSMQTATNRGAAGAMENGKFSSLNANSNNSGHHIPSSTSTPNIEHSSHGPMEGRSPPFTGPSPMFLHPHPLTMASGIHPTARGGGPMMIGQNHSGALGNSGATNFAAVPFPMLLPFINQMAAVNANAVKQEQKPAVGLATSRTPSSASSSNSAASCPSPAAAAAHSQLQQQHLHSLMAQFAPNPNAAAYCSSSASPVAAGVVVGGNTVGNWPSAIQQQLHHNFLLFQQQHLPKMPQQNQQRQSPKQQQQQLPTPPINGTTDPAMLAQQQQFLLQFFAALAASGSSNNPFVASNGRPFQMGVGGVLQQQYPNGGNNNNTGNFALQQLMNANKKLARDADGNAICPACKEPIGTNPAQLAKHLALERSRVQEALQNLKRKAQSRENGRKSPTAVSGQANGANLTGTAEEKQKREEILEGIHKKQQIRIQARRSGQSYTASESLSKILADTENLTSPKGNAENGQKSNHFEGSNASQEPSNFGLPHDDADDNAIEADKLKELGQICPQCKIPSEFLVINVTSKAPVPFQCLECFQQQHHRARPSQIMPTGIDMLNGNNHHNHVQGRKRPSSTIVLTTTSTTAATNGSGGGSAFASALELANVSPAIGIPKIASQNNGGAHDHDQSPNEQPLMDDGMPMKKAKFTAADEEINNSEHCQTNAKVNGGMERHGIE